MEFLHLQMLAVPVAAAFLVAHVPVVHFLGQCVHDKNLGGVDYSTKGSCAGFLIQHHDQDLVSSDICISEKKQMKMKI